MQIRVYYEDTDAGGIVYHSNYLNFCERARSEFFFKQNIPPIIDDAHFVVRKIECDFLKSAKFGDLIEVSSKIIEIKKSSLKIYQEITKDNDKLFTATFVLVLVKDGKIKRIDENIKNRLLSLFISTKR
ncbi:MAG: YbgC/FadM family acyl-CoA thioesterase [Campylobacterota bacterium]|nr:YbgC/FadM family acyl-CoA thioesterase [Campylobacterota bacterium]